MSPDLSHELAAAKDIARRAGAIMLRYFDGDKQIEIKDDSSPVTKADKEINRFVIEELAMHFPDGVIGEEESTAEYGPGRRWICDPIDGTKGYIIGVPTSMFSLGFVEDGAVQLGVAYDPFLDKLYCASRGAGSFCNDARLSVLGKGLEGGYVALTGNPKRIGRYAESISTLASRGADLVSMGGSVYKMCMVARGSLVGYLEAGVNAHDTVAGHIIVEEAGGKVTDFKGAALDYSRPFKGAVFSNALVHDDLIKSVASIESQSYSLKVSESVDVS